jgi:hypothetical protein
MASGVPLTGARMLGAARRWGASGEEIASVQPGDDVVADPQLVSTRAITIEAPPADVFPWLAQLGQGRGGFYSYDWVENLIGLDIHSADTLLPEFREVRAGTQIRMAPGPKFYGFVVVDAEAPTHLVLQMRIHPFTGEQLEPAPRRQGPEVHASWAFVVTQIAEGRSRLVARTRARLELPFGLRQAYCLLLESVEFAMERRMLLGIRDRAECTRPDPALRRDLEVMLPG